ncbi:hypothetical protein CALCODRAFT_26312 [Calocera cornea HHB12733]|uniref:Uncharacterized protein n=1 Tax=Calocera cornea HHB12733 TaxID=1353952 RepID=A0A165J3D8_9BASI|nr:hypothetical protein CALCODRAFT_26312 [Calocera cornea HHB12733]
MIHPALGPPPLQAPTHPPEKTPPLPSCCCRCLLDLLRAAERDGHAQPGAQHPEPRLQRLCRPSLSLLPSPHPARYPVPPLPLPARTPNRTTYAVSEPPSRVRNKTCGAPDRGTAGPMTSRRTEGGNPRALACAARRGDRLDPFFLRFCEEGDALPHLGSCRRGSCFAHSEFLLWNNIYVRVGITALCYV